MKISGLDRSKIPQLILQFVAKIAREDGPLKQRKIATLTVLRKSPYFSHENIPFKLIRTFIKLLAKQVILIT